MSPRFVMARGLAPALRVGMVGPQQPRFSQTAREPSPAGPARREPWDAQERAARLERGTRLGRGNSHAEPAPDGAEAKVKSSWISRTRINIDSSQRVTRACPGQQAQQSGEKGGGVICGERAYLTKLRRNQKSPGIQSNTTTMLGNSRPPEVRPACFCLPARLLITVVTVMLR